MRPYLQAIKIRIQQIWYRPFLAEVSVREGAHSIRRKSARPRDAFTCDRSTPFRSEIVDQLWGAALE